MTDLSGIEERLVETLQSRPVDDEGLPMPARMPTFHCGGKSTPGVVEKLLGLLHCCHGAAELGLDSCTCWEPIYDDGPFGQSPQLVDRPRSLIRAGMCEDCAYRPDSPERNGDPNYAHNRDGDLDEVAGGRDSVFFCHQGTRRVIAWEHRTLGIRIDQGDVDHYDPPIVEGHDGRPVPLKLDGVAADRCAGWAARRAQIDAIPVDV